MTGLLGMTLFGIIKQMQHLFGVAIMIVSPSGALSPSGDKASFGGYNHAGNPQRCCICLLAPPGNSKLLWHPARLINEWGCVDLSMDTLHLKYPLVLFRSEDCSYSPSSSFI